MNRFSISERQIESSPVRTIGFVVYPDVEVIDVVGPMEVFVFANRALQQEGLISDPVYQVKLLGNNDQSITTLSGLQIGPVTCYETFKDPLDTLIVPGGSDPEVASNNLDLVNWIRIRSKAVRRVASVCNGAFILAQAGLFKGRRATTHWNYASRFRKKFPTVELDPDRIFIQDGSVWSSGGITSGIDLALAMLEDDWGHKLALYVARYLVLFVKRQGSQSQHSDYLRSDALTRRDITELKAWIMENTHEDLRVEVLAERMAMSPRNFARIFHTETGVSPAKFVEMVRTDLARHYLESTRLSIEVIAENVGFKNTETMRRTFIRHIGISPAAYRIRFDNLNKGPEARFKKVVKYLVPQLF
ncbi:MAG: GlxA family transcriptional regulator [Gammaproteobacteria bacterium]